MAQPRNKNFSSPSQADRFFGCPGSVQAQEAITVDLPPSPSAVEGTAIHALASKCLKERLWAKDLIGSEFTIDYEGQPYTFEVTDDFAYTVDLYRRTILRILGENGVSEDALQVEVYEEVPDLDCGKGRKFGGTTDCRFIAGSTLHVFDLKGGRGIIVDPTENKQTMGYAIRMVELAGMFIDKVKLWIIQPRAKEGDFVKCWDTTPERILAFKEEVREKLTLTRTANPPRNPGEYCGFCVAAATCLSLQKGIMKTTALAVPKLDGKIFPVVRELTPEQIGRALPALGMLKEFMDQLEGYAFTLAMKGVDIPGYTLTKSKKHRTWVNEEAAIEFLSKHLPQDEFMTTPKLMTPAQVEKLVEKSLLKNYITTPEGDFKLVPEKEAKEFIKRSVDDVFKDVALD